MLPPNSKQMSANTESRKANVAEKTQYNSCLLSSEDSCMRTFDTEDLKKPWVCFY